MTITKEQIESSVRDSAKFSNFAQAVKFKYWKGLQPGQTHVAEYLVDDLLLIAWEVLNDK